MRGSTITITYKIMPVSEIAAGFSAIKTLKDLVGSIKGITDQAERSQLIIQAQDQILTLHETIFSAQQELNNAIAANSELSAKITEYEDWSKQAANYELDAFRPGIMAYRFIGDSANPSTPSHWICPTCFASKETHILQQPKPDDPLVECPNCKWHFDISEREANCVGISMG